MLKDDVPLNPEEKPVKTGQLLASQEWRDAKGWTADNTSRNKICVAHTTQNSHWSKSIRCQSNLICSNYAINNFQSECWYRVCQNKGNQTSARYCVWITAYERDFFIFGKIRLLAVEWYVLHAKWIKNKRVRVR
jgi:hypothetical protein